jgi:hypothetical protein
MSRVSDPLESADLRVLRGVEVFGCSALPNVAGLVILDLSHLTVFILVESDDDTLVCSRELSDRHRVEYNVPIATTFWTPLLGQTLTTVWRMTADRGFPDALQLRFRTFPNDGDYTIVLLEAVASEIVQSELRVVRKG